MKPLHDKRCKVDGCSFGLNPNHVDPISFRPINTFIGIIINWLSKLATLLRQDKFTTYVRVLFPPPPPISPYGPGTAVTQSNVLPVIIWKSNYSSPTRNFGSQNVRMNLIPSTNMKRNMPVAHWELRYSRSVKTHTELVTQTSWENASNRDISVAFRQLIVHSSMK